LELTVPPGDTAHCDQDGCYCFVGRADDVINTTGHLVGPFEIESALLDCESDAEGLSAIATTQIPVGHQRVTEIADLVESAAS
jgi:acyl-coenzyme A synthetase/AMP-(fatty) acid ligase